MRKKNGSRRRVASESQQRKMGACPVHVLCAPYVMRVISKLRMQKSFMSLSAVIVLHVLAQGQTGGSERAM